MHKALHGTTYIIDYILAIADFVVTERCDNISFGDIHKITKNVAVNAQITQEIEAGKRYRDYRKKSQEDESFMREAADKTASAMVLWGLMERIPSNEKEPGKVKNYHIKPTLRAIGQEANKSQVHTARLILFDRMLRSEKGTAFGVDFFLKIRDSEFSSNVAREFNLPKLGITLWNASNLRTNFEISEPDFTMLTFWCRQVGFLNIFDPRTLEISSPKEVYLTAWIASLSELSSFYERAISKRKDIESYVDQNCEKILKRLHAIDKESDRIVALLGSSLNIANNEFLLQNLNSPFSSDLLVIGEKNKTQQLILSNKTLAFDQIFLLLKKQVSQEEFVRTLVQNYRLLKIKFKTPYVWISPLRSLCARSLQITDRQFDDLLVQYYRIKPEAMEFSKAATGFFRKRVRVFEKPFKLYGQSFRMIRLVEMS